MDERGAAVGDDARVTQAHLRGRVYNLLALLSADVNNNADLLHLSKDWLHTYDQAHALTF
jgi:hypothetical protein